ncbi:MAG: CHRD domain-containing protein [Acidobacteria bacterium]|nr:CHRD domain-containing protein [Acidobacteriota bacterium]
MKQKSSISRLRIWKTIFIVFAVCLATVVPFYFGSHSEAQTATGTFLGAPLTGDPIGNVTPQGFARYAVDPMNNKTLDVQVSGVNLPPATSLNVLIDGASVGSIRLASARSGVLHLIGQAVPTVNEGSTVAVKNGDTVVLSGVFATPPTPSPSPTRTMSPTPTGSPSPSPTRTPPPPPTPLPTPSAAFFAPLEGATIDGVMPRGIAQYAEFSTDKVLNVFVDHVRLPNTTLTVYINDASVGQITLNSAIGGVLRLSTANGDTVPTIVADNTATVKNGDTTVLAGTFRAFTTPTPHPSPSVTPTGSPSPTPTGSPTPHPSPRPNRVFGGHLDGAQVVPAVTTDARGMVGVRLNAGETQIEVICGFNGLSSAQTTATINGPAMAGETAATLFDLGTVGGTSGRFAPQTFDVTAEQVAQLRSGLWYVQIGSTDNPTGEIRGQIRSRTRPSAFAGTGTDDIAVFRPSNGAWYVKDGTGYTTQFLGQNGDQTVSGDFDGDGKTDYAVFRSGTWLISRSSDGGLTTKQFGLAGDIAVRGDYDGDGQSDLAVFRPSTGVWYIEKSSGSGYIITQFGMNGDKPVGADLDGDGRTDIAVFRPSTGVWYWGRSSKGDTRAAQFGTNGDVPIVGDFDADGTDDLTVYRPSTGVWYAWRSSNGTYDIRQFGLSTDIPAAGNYDADGATDIAVFRPSTGVWYIWRSSDNTYDINYFGINGDIPANNR